MKLWRWLMVAAVSAMMLSLAVYVGAQAASITLDWTAPGDDDNTGTASVYEMRWSATKPDTTTTAKLNTWWGAATVVPGMPAPLVAGSAQSTTITAPFATGTTYYAVLRTADEVPNWSAYSNVARWTFADVTPPASCSSLKAR